MSCLLVRESLTEYALGLLGPDETDAVERHLEWCAGCRKEAGELQEGVGSIAFDLPVAEPPRTLEERVVERVQSAAGRRGTAARPRETSSGRGRRLAAVSLAAAVVAVGSFGWAIAMRGQVEDLRTDASQTQTKLERVLKLTDALQGSGKPFEARLWAVRGRQGGGTAIIFSPPRGDDFLFVETTALSPETGPYTVRVETRSGLTLTAGQLAKTNNDSYVLGSGHWFPADLSKAETVSVMDRSGKVVLSGLVHPYSYPFTEGDPSRIG